MSLDLRLTQPSLPGFCEVDKATSTLANADIEGRGAVFTRREVVDFILDLTGYIEDKPLHKNRLLEPSMGQGDFLIPAIDRLLGAYSKLSPSQRGDIVVDLGNCFRAVELHRESYQEARELAASALRSKGVKNKNAQALCDRWLHQGDFLLHPLEGQFTHVVGNPPYVRQELIPDVLMVEYRRRYHTIYDRADLYIPFIERSLSLLSSQGNIGFICADRWIKNRYGGPLRRLVADHYNLKFFVDMVDTPAFHSNVIAYPAIIVIGKEKTDVTRIAYRPEIDTIKLQSLARTMQTCPLPKGKGVTEAIGVASGAEPWMLEASEQMSVIRRLESSFPTLSDAGCKVGIGVATGTDHAFIGNFDELDVEIDRKLPLATTRDIVSGTVRWRGLGVINPFMEDGSLVSLTAYPKLAAHLERYEPSIKARYISKKNPAKWYRTIDRIYPELARTPKLLIPDIKGTTQVVYEPGNLYPHHNLYHVTSDGWDLHALQAVLLADITRLFISLYSTKMRGGYLRFQAQYLRRLRLPLWKDVGSSLRSDLICAGRSRDVMACNSATATLYALTAPEISTVTSGLRVANAA